MKLYKYRCSTCGKVWYEEEVQGKVFHPNHGCPDGCDDAGEYLGYVEAQLSTVEKPQESQEWKIKEWTGLSDNPFSMAKEEVALAIKYLRDNHYPKPADCIMEKCRGYRPACHLGVCYVAVRLCGDF